LLKHSFCSLNTQKFILKKRHPVVCFCNYLIVEFSNKNDWKLFIIHCDTLIQQNNLMNIMQTVRRISELFYWFNENYYIDLMYYFRVFKKFLHWFNATFFIDLTKFSIDIMNCLHWYNENVCIELLNFNIDLKQLLRWFNEIFSLI
jgi:hypothetical protein